MPPSPTPQRSRRAESSKDEFEQLKRLIHGKLVDKLDLSRLGELEGDTLRREIRLVVEHLCDTENPLLNRSERERLIEEVLDETFGFGPLEILMKEEGVADIMINGPKNVFVEKKGRIQKSDVTFRDDDHLLQILDRIVSRVGRRVDETSPMVDARLPDGSRLNAIIPPLALDGPSLTIRKFGSKPLGLEDLLRFGAFTPEMVMLLEGAIKARLNIIISGGTGSGKTTLLNTLSSSSRTTSASSPLRTRPNSPLAGARCCGWRPGRRTSKARGGSRRPTWSRTPCVCDPTGSSSANAAAPNRWTCSRP